jgi:hemerythrin-like metal-binding protein
MKKRNLFEEIQEGFEALVEMRDTMFAVTLFTQTKTLRDAVIQQDGERIPKLLQQIIVQMGEHFHHEEELMSACSYEFYHEHQMEHAAMLREMWEFKRKLEEGAEPCLTIPDFIDAWLEQHVIQKDLSFLRWGRN